MPVAQGHLGTAQATSTQPFDSDTFRAALQQTIERRGTVDQMADAYEAIDMITESPIMINLWQKYAEKYSYAADVCWDTVINSLKQLRNALSE